jgi:hypothetical protein
MHSSIAGSTLMLPMKARDQSMHVAQLECGTGRKPIQAILAWSFAVLIVALAVFGPPLTRHNAPALVQLRHDILTIDREFERWSIRTASSFRGTGTLVQDDRGRTRKTRPNIPYRGDVL